MSDGIWLDRVGSTLDELHVRAATGAPDGTWLVAAEQLAGRGSRGRHWHSPRGGLWLSILRRDKAAFGGLDLLSIRAGLAVATLLDGLPAVEPVMLKWPNDLMVHDLKVGGLLVEARWQGDRLHWVALGLGLNVRNPIPDELAGRATSLDAYCAETTVEALAQPIAQRLAAVDLDSPELSDSEVTDYAARDWLLGRPVLEPVVGTGSGVGRDGRLTVRDPSGQLQRVSLGTVLPG